MLGAAAVGITGVWLWREKRQKAKENEMVKVGDRSFTVPVLSQYALVQHTLGDLVLMHSSAGPEDRGQRL